MTPVSWLNDRAALWKSYAWLPMEESVVQAAGECLAARAFFVIPRLPFYSSSVGLMDL
jgi:hypothetical protein